MDERGTRESLPNEVFERDLHTGDVIHNHFYSHPRDTSNLQTDFPSSPSSNIARAELPFTFSDPSDIKILFMD